MSAPITTIVPIKSVINKNRVLLIALGIFFSGWLVSPAATPINSVPLKAKFAESNTIKTAPNPLGKIPLDTKFLNKGALVACAGRIPVIAVAPKIIKIPRATILTRDIQNSLTENILISKTLSNKIKIEKIAHQSQIGVCGNHFCKQTPIVMNCEPSATVHVSQ